MTRSPLRTFFPGLFLAITALFAGGGALSGQASVRDAAETFAREWNEGGNLEPLLPPDGIRIHLERSSHTAISRRQALAVLSEYRASFRGGETRVVRASETEGDPRRGYAEVEWRALPRRGGEEPRSLFLGFLGMEEGWRVSEIRIVR